MTHHTTTFAFGLKCSKRNNNKTKQNNLFTVKQTNMALSKTKVQFLYNENENDLYAFFPEEIANRVTRNKLSYSHVGQHSECSQEYADESREATKEEYLDLYHELTNLVGYDLQIVKR